MKLKHISAVAVLALLLPFAASAITVDELQQQIRSLLTQIAQLQQQLKNLQTEDQTPIACTMEARVCPDGSAVGRTGPNCEFAACPRVKPVPPITRICPQILRTLDEGISGPDVKDLQTYLGVSPTGYFGPMTARAVAALQADEGLAQVGIVGPQTRAAFARRCGWGNHTFTASPTSGQTPLAVSFSASGGKEGDYSIDFGDGSSGAMTRGPVTACAEYPYPTPVNCGRYPFSASHTYTQNGTYVAKLMYQEPFVCDAPPGAACTTVVANPKQVGTAVIRVGGSTGTGAPSITSVSGPASLTTGQSGTWTVHASVQNSANAQLRYSVIWGDEGVLDTLNTFAGIAASPTLQTSGSFTHLYARAGTYRPTFTVSNDFGSAQTSVSVVVGADDGVGYGYVCPVYQLTACSVGQKRVDGTPTYDENGCQVPRWTCVSDSTSSSKFSASPMSGAAPLTVNFSGTVPSAGYSIDFGDGTRSGDVRCGHGGCPTSPLSSNVNTSHTYSSAGTYVAKLRQHFTTNAGNCAGVDCNVVGTVTITVGGPAPTGLLLTDSCPLYAMRVCPAGQMRVAAPDTYDSNGCPVPNGTCVATDDSASAEQNTNLANVLTALEAALKKFLGQ